MTEEELEWLATAVAKGLDWISPADAKEMIRDRLGCSVGRAQALLQIVCTAEPSEVRSCNDDPQRRWERTWCISKSDVADWLDRQAPQKAEPTHRYSGDAALIERGRKMIADGMTKSEDARRLAPDAEGGSDEQRYNRLRKLF